MRRTTCTVALAVAAVLGVGAEAPREGKMAAGSYCPLPEGDEPPACLQPAAQDYQRFFSGLEHGTVEDAALAEVEKDLGGEERYQALSTLAYAYYRLSLHAAAGDAVDPEVVGRLERWSALLGDTYRANAEDAVFRDAMREAAGDIRRRAPAVRIRCTDERGQITECDSNTAVAASLTDLRDRTGLRGALARLLERIFGE